MLISVELLSPYRALIGIFYQKGTEMINNQKKLFSEVSFGLLFIFIRFAKYSDIKEGE